MKHIIEEFEKRYFEIPFENSDFQNKYFVAGTQYSKARAYRSILLRMSAKIRALKESQYTLKLTQVDIDQWQHTINTSKDAFEIRKAKIEIDHILDQMNYTKKLISDSEHELEYLYSLMKEFPEYNRQQFELEEQKHFEKKLQLLSTGIPDAMENLFIIGSEPLPQINNDIIKKLIKE